MKYGPQAGDHYLCKHVQLQHKSGADLLVSTLGHRVKRKDIIGNCGHALYAEEPHTLAGLLVAFQVK